LIIWLTVFPAYLFGRRFDGPGCAHFIRKLPFDLHEIRAKGGEGANFISIQHG
jgi:hypothetical protein